jgi:hypothetical protein
MLAQHLGSEAEVEAVLRGRIPADRDDLAAVAALVERLHQLAASEPAPPMRAELRALVAGQAGAEDRFAFLDRRQRRRVGALGVAAAAVVVFGATGVAAATNSLPSSLQDTVSNVADVVGVDVPRSEDRGHAGEDPQPDKGNDVKGHNPQGPKGGNADKETGPGVDPNPDNGNDADGHTDNTGNAPDANPGDTAPGQQDNPSASTVPDTVPDDPGRPDDPGGNGDRTSTTKAVKKAK